MAERLCDVCGCPVTYEHSWTSFKNEDDELSFVHLLCPAE